MTRERKLREVLNVRLDVPLARELQRIAGSRGLSESEVARQLLSYGVDVDRQLEAQRLARPYRNDYEDEHFQQMEIVEIEARTRPMTFEEQVRNGLITAEDLEQLEADGEA